MRLYARVEPFSDVAIICHAHHVIALFSKAIEHRILPAASHPLNKLLVRKKEFITQQLRDVEITFMMLSLSGIFL